MINEVEFNLGPTMKKAGWVRTRMCKRREQHVLRGQGLERAWGPREEITNWTGSSCEHAEYVYPFHVHYRRLDQARRTKMNFSEMNCVVNFNL